MKKLLFISFFFIALSVEAQIIRIIEGDTLTISGSSGNLSNTYTTQTVSSNNQTVLAGSVKTIIEIDGDHDIALSQSNQLKNLFSIMALSTVTDSVLVTASDPATVFRMPKQKTNNADGFYLKAWEDAVVSRDKANEFLVQCATCSVYTNSVGGLLNESNFNGQGTWNLSNGSTISGGFANVVGAGAINFSAGNHVLEQPITLTNGTTYDVEIRMRATSTTGDVYIGENFFQHITQAVTNTMSTYNLSFTAQANGDFTVGAESGVNLEVDHIILTAQ